MRFQLLGPVEVFGPGGEPVALPGARARAILTMLLLARPGVVPPSRLYETGHTAKDPVNALHVQIAKLRAALPEPRLVSEPGGYRLITYRGEVDADVFAEECAKQPAVLRDALALWRGPLPGYDFADAWRAHMEELRLTALERVIDAELGQGRERDLVPELIGLTAAHPLRERFTGQLMVALHRSGRRAEALTAFARLRERLADELGTDPLPELTGLHVDMLRDEPVPTRAEPGKRPVGNVPHPIGSLIGRDADLREVSRLLTEHRLVTLVGPGGVGKTRAAGELGHRLRDCYRDGAWLVELGSVPRDGSVLEAVAAVLLPDEGAAHSAPARERLMSYLGDREVLLVLDNCEHVIDDAATQVRLLLGRCPGLSVLATSREPLNIQGECPVALAPLELAEAMRLFRDRAPGIPDDDEAVAGLCARLDGLPLALELAAAGTRLFSLPEIESKLDSLGNAARHAPARHHSLRAVLDWSHDLLSPEEREVFAALSVFSDGCTFADAERVCGATVDLMARLVDKSLVVRGRDGRLRMLETVRAYAESTMDTTSFRERHADALLELANEAQEHLTGPRQRELMTVLLAELPNVRAVTTWLLRRGDGLKAATLHGSLGYFWFVSGREGEGASWLRRAVDCFDAHPVPDADEPVGRALSWLGWLGAVSGADPDPWAVAVRLRDLCRASPEPLIQGGLTSAAAVAVQLRPVDEARSLLEEAEEVLAGFDHPWLRSVLDGVWSDQYRREGDLAAAVRAATANLEFFEACRNPFGIVYSQLRLGDAEEHAGHRERARDRWLQARDTARIGFAPVKRGYAELRLSYLELSDDSASVIPVLERVRADALDLAADDLHAAAVNLLGLAHLRHGDADAACGSFHEASTSTRAHPIRVAVAAAQLAILDCPKWITEARRAVERVTDPLPLAALRALIDNHAVLDPVRRALPARPVATPLAALA